MNLFKVQVIRTVAFIYTTVISRLPSQCFNLMAPSFRLGKVSFRQVLNLLAYMSNETETAPLTEGLGQLMHILRMLEKRQDLNLVGRMKVSPPCRFKLNVG